MALRSIGRTARRRAPRRILAEAIDQGFLDEKNSL
jgi:hypothetical protein